MNDAAPQPQPDAAPASSAAQRPLPSRDDIEATLCALLIRFRDSSPEEQQHVENFAKAGADALMTELHSPTWLDSQQSAKLLGIPEEALIEQAEKHVLPAARDRKGQPRVHRRDLSLHRMSLQLGATEGQWTQVVTPIAWSDDLTASGFNPWDEITPG
jgi:hypothetical protein